MKVWITRYALTRRIIEGEARRISDDSIEIVEGEYKNAWFYRTDWHSDKESALTKAEEMRKKRITSLRKQIEKFEKLRFE